MMDTTTQAKINAAVATTTSGRDATEPALTTGTLLSAVNGIFTLVGSFGVVYSAGLPNYVSATIVILATLFAIALPFIQGKITRGQVFSPATVAMIVDELTKGAATATAIKEGRPVPADTPVLPESSPASAPGGA